MNIIKNQETQKIELHFEKSEYMAMSEEQKKDLKSAFLWSRYAGAWVSRSTSNHYWALRIAEKLGFDVKSIEKVGERLSYAEELERKAEKAERRAERMEEYAYNAEKRAENLQSGWNRHRGDIAFLTQPIIAGHAGSQRFGRQREKIFDRYRKGFEEYRKSEYFRNRAETARGTASMAQLKDPVYLHNRIKECKATIAKLEKNIIAYEERLHRIENGEVIKNYNGDIIPAEKYQDWIEETLEKIEYYMDKQAFMENHLDDIGGIQFSKDNIKVGFIVEVRYSGQNCEVVSAGPVNITYKILDGGAKGMVLKAPYAEILKIVKATEKKDEIINPYEVGDILCAYYHAGNSIYKAYQVVKTTKTGVKLQQIAVENGKPVKDKFISDKQTQRKIIKSKWSDWVGVYEDDWQLHKYQAKAEAV
jgi:hypothetical protein